MNLTHVTAVALSLAAATALSGQQTQKPTFVSRIDLVTLDVVVRDKQGLFVPDLTMDDFIVLEDGVRQSLADYRAHRAGREVSGLASTASAAPEGMVLPPSRPASDMAGRLFVIFIDDLHLQAGETPRVRSLLTQITDRLIHDGDLFTVVSTGPSSIEQQLTYDRTRLTESIKKVMGGGMTPQEILLAPNSTNGPQELRHRMHVALATAYDLLKQLEPFNDRRKAFIYVSSGYDFNPFTDSRWKLEQERFAGPQRDANGNPLLETGIRSRERDTMNPFETGSQAFAQADLVAQVAELGRAANRANTTLYTIDPRGLIAGPDINQDLTTSEWRSHVTTQTDSLKSIAELTGGVCLCNTNDFEKGIERIDNETSDYYILRYYSSNPDPLRKVRKIEVKARRPGLTVFHRSERALPYR